MAFSSVQFLFIFLPLSLAVYWLLPKALRNGALGAFSLLFFAWAGLKGAAILLALALLCGAGLAEMVFDGVVTGGDAQFVLAPFGGVMDEVNVRVGDRVTLGQRLGDGEGLCAPVHASVSGTVVAVEPRPHPGGTDMPAVVIENDGRDTLCPTIQKRASPLTLPPDELIAIIREAGITGMGGAGFPTGAKLASAVGKVDTVLVNGAECEPYITADDRLMRQTPERVLGGLRVICRILQPKRAVVGIERNKPEAIAAMRAAAGSEAEVLALRVRSYERAQAAGRTAEARADAPAAEAPVAPAPAEPAAQPEENKPLTAADLYAVKRPAKTEAPADDQNQKEA